ncbi:hypothetical protein NP233_g12973 [Leucocoprinus birnbaumii]|uniref:Uncharacterized protein n=1 Tax=Leucocoprinus birnbaumii TaxID=56174 RepID=A0AAD5YPH1_9AGAR|nr:hypothetical protein NP233_g12973 [Leucocoprinus birnbaumii]
MAQFHRPSLATLSMELRHEILSYFLLDLEPLGLESAGDILEKRTTALSLALVSRSLSDIALDTLWKEMSTLQPVVSVIEASALIPVFRFQHHRRLASESSQWKITGTVHPDKFRPRVIEYLKRIKRLVIINPSRQEFTLWSALTQFLKPTGYLLPELQALMVQWHNPHLPPVYPTLIPLVSPTLHTLHLHAFHTSHFFPDPIVHYLHLIGGNPQELQLSTPCSRSLLPAFSSFSTLRELFMCTSGEHGVPHNDLMSVQDLFTSFPKLDDLTLDLRAIRLDKSQIESVMQLPVLRTLSPSGRAQDITKFLSMDIDFPNVTDVGLQLVGEFEESATWGDIFRGISKVSACVDTVHFDMLADNQPMMFLHDLAPIFGCSLKSLSLDCIKHQLSLEDIGQMLRAWPMLEELYLGNPVNSLDAAVLGICATHGTLRSLSIHVDLDRLTRQNQAATEIMMDYPKMRSEIRDLRLCTSLRSSSTLEHKATLIRNLLIFFPVLESISLSQREEQEKELGVLLSLYKTAYKNGSDVKSKSKLKTLHLHYSLDDSVTLEDKAKLTQTLFSFFPALETISLSDDDDATDNEYLRVLLSRYKLAFSAGSHFGVGPS